MIKLLVDSASDCKKEDGIFDLFIPIAINIDGKEYLDGVDINNDMFYEMLLKTKNFPHTSQPSTQDFVDIFESVKADGDELIYLAISSELSGTYQSATIAKSMVGYEGIHIIDTLGATHMISLLAGYAKQLITEGFSAEAIVNNCEALKGRIRVVAGVETLEYLRRGGRLSNASAIVGTLANIKPIVTVIDGKVESIGKCIGRPKAMQFLVDKVKSFDVDENFPMYSLYTYGEENCQVLEDKLTDEGYSITKRLQVGSTIGTHVGPNIYGILFVSK